MQDRLYERSATLMVLVLVGQDVFAGPLRFVLANAGLEALVYFPKVLCIGLMGLQIVVWFARGQVDRLLIIVACVVICAVAVGLVFTSSLAQVGFGVWVLLPFFLGLYLWRVQSIAEVLSDRRCMRLVTLFWLISVSGVFLNAVVEFPWVGFTYNVGDVTLEGARSWSVTGIYRVGGLSQSSFDAANQILLTALLLVRTAPPALRRVVYVVSLGAILLTTMKASLLALILVIIVRRLSKVWGETMLRISVVAALVVGIVLPMIAIYEPYVLRTDSRLPDGFKFLAGSSVDRFDTTWPDTWRLLQDEGSTILGRGLGGIGTAQLRFEPGLYSPADNLAVYTFAVFGLIGVLALLFLPYLLMKSGDTRNRQLLLLLAFALLTMGWASNLFESTSTALVLGILVGQGVASLVHARGPDNYPGFRTLTVRWAHPRR